MFSSLLAEKCTKRNLIVTLGLSLRNLPEGAHGNEQHSINVLGQAMCRVAHGYDQVEYERH
eukprot:1437353-Amphidinium_carterae.1